MFYYLGSFYFFYPPVKQHWKKSMGIKCRLIDKNSKPAVEYGTKIAVWNPQQTYFATTAEF